MTQRMRLNIVLLKLTYRQCCLSVSIHLLYVLFCCNYSSIQLYNLFYDLMTEKNHELHSPQGKLVITINLPKILLGIL